MLTNNAKTAVLCQILFNSQAYRSKLPVKLCDGNTWYCSSADWPGSKGFTFRTNYTSQGIVLGTGNTPPTADDYMLDSIITGGVTVSSVSTAGMSDGNFYTRLDMLVMNTGNSPITVSEIGWIGTVNASPTQNVESQQTKMCLMDRTLLTTPVTIPAGNSETIRYELLLTP